MSPKAVKKFFLFIFCCFLFACSGEKETTFIYFFDDAKEGIVEKSITVDFSLDGGIIVVENQLLSFSWKKSRDGKIRGFFRSGGRQEAGIFFLCSRGFRIFIYDELLRDQEFMTRLREKHRCSSG